MTTTTGRAMSDPQRDLITRLTLEVNPETGADAAATFFAKGPSVGMASALIDTLIAESKERRRAMAAAGTPVSAGMPAVGCYAVEYGGVLRFYRVKEGRGSYAGRLFLNRFQSDEMVRIVAAERITVCADILRDPAAAQRRFAAELTRCYCCGRMLTDADSRVRGMGPECYGRGRGRGALDDAGIPALQDI